MCVCVCVYVCIYIADLADVLLVVVALAEGAQLLGRPAQTFERAFEPFGANSNHASTKSRTLESEFGSLRGAGGWTGH